MNDNVFLDTNLLVYGYSIGEPEKQRIAQQLITNNISFISTQVLQELANTLIRKFNISYADTIQVIHECSNNNLVHVNSESTIIQACRIADQYRFSFYDSLIISSALECHCSVLYSEDMNNGQILIKFSPSEILIYYKLALEYHEKNIMLISDYFISDFMFP